MDDLINMMVILTLYFGIKNTGTLVNDGNSSGHLHADTAEKNGLVCVV